LGTRINTPLLLPPPAARPTIEEHPHLEPQNPQDLLPQPTNAIFGESKESALIYILTEAIHFPLSFA
jgi:hypothetical protein